jgi:hypothetical protein
MKKYDIFLSTDFALTINAAGFTFNSDNNSFWFFDEENNVVAVFPIGCSIVDTSSRAN